MVWVWKISPKTAKFFNILPLGLKKISSDWVKKYPGQRRVGLSFTTGQKYAQVRAHIYKPSKIFQALPSKLTFHTQESACRFKPTEVCNLDRYQRHPYPSELHAALPN